MSEKAISLICNHIGIENLNSSESLNFLKLVDHLEYLIKNDFNKLISILYRIDVSEEKAKKALAEKEENESSGYILAKLLIEREKEKIKFREKYRNNRNL
jgi:hypothetical protein